MEIELAEAARIMGVSVRRARALVASGRAPGRKVAGRWVVDAASASPRPVVRAPRPMSVMNAWSLAQLAEGAEVAIEERTVLRRLRHALEKLGSDGGPALAEAWLASRAQRTVWTAYHPDVVVADPRTAVSGVSDSRCGMAASGVGEAYVRRADLDSVVLDCMLTPAMPSAGNVVLHVVDGRREVRAPLPALVVVADLMEWNRPRERAAAAALLEQVL